MEIHKSMGIKRVLLDKIKDILLEHEKVERAVVFGSRARGNYKKTSDIDICIYGKEMASMEMNLIEDKIRELDTPIDFDIVYFNRIVKIELKENIEKDGVEIYVKG